jgi:alkylation response protein AidB-like acyl-CoA dehydrogenase
VTDGGVDASTDFRAEVRAFAETHVHPRAAGIDRDERLPEDLVAALRAAGYLGARLPALHGGRALGLTDYGVLHLELGRACASTRSLLTVHDMVAETVTRFGSSAAKAALLPRLASGATLAAFALTEPDFGSDAGGIETTATEEDDSYVLSGRKRWISFAQLADLFLVIARTDGDHLAGFLVPRTTPGLRVAPTTGLLGLRGSMLGELTLDGCRVPSEHRVGPAKMPSNIVTATALQLGRFSVACGCVGLAAACLDASREHAATRVQFDVSIDRHQLVRRMLTDMATTVRASWLLCLDAASAIEQRAPRAVEATLMAKYFASRTAASVATDAVQLHGALGCSDQRPVERHFRDAKIMEIIEGSTQIQQITIARHLGEPTASFGAGQDGVHEG